MLFKDDDRAVDIKIQPQYLFILVKEMERTFNINGTATKTLLQEYLQYQYDNLENKDGSVNLNLPPMNVFKEYVNARINMEVQ